MIPTAFSIRRNERKPKQFHGNRTQCSSMTVCSKINAVKLSYLSRMGFIYQTLVKVAEKMLYLNNSHILLVLKIQE